MKKKNLLGHPDKEQKACGVQEDGIEDTRSRQSKILQIRKQVLRQQEKLSKYITYSFVLSIKHYCQDFACRERNLLASQQTNHLQNADN